IDDITAPPDIRHPGEGRDLADEISTFPGQRSWVCGFTSFYPFPNLRKAVSAPPMILVIDNYDSFTFNLVHYLIELGAEVRVERNDALTAAEALGSGAGAILISPGPCT